MDLDALVFFVEEFSFFDGPGIRTTVFLKGCPLRCSWCHNPEGQSFENEIIKAQSGCIGCKECLKAGGGVLNESSIRVCPERLLRFCGERYTPEALIKRLEGNFDILKMSGGGITFSGGEPLAHKAFLKECLKLLKGRIHTAVQTSGFCDTQDFKEILALSDYFLFDIKLINSEEHLQYTGVKNGKILQNFAELCESSKDFTVRTPLIPRVTDSPENLEGIACFLRKKGVKRIELLPYNRAAGGKYSSVGRVYAPNFDESIPVRPRVEIFSKYGIDAVIM